MFPLLNTSWFAQAEGTSHPNRIAGDGMNRLVILAFVIGGACADASAATIYDTIGSWRGPVSNKWEHAAQIFTAPTRDTTLSTFALGVGGGGGGTYSVALYRWDPSGQHAVGAPLFTRAAESVPGEVTFTEFTVNAQLIGGGDYAMVTTLSSPDGSGVAFSDSNPYSPGDV